MFRIAENVKTFIESSMESCKTSSGGKCGTSEYKKRYFLKEIVYLLCHFVICMIPLSFVLRKVKAGYEFRGKQLKINHLLFVDDLNLFEKNDEQINPLVKTVHIFSKDIGMEFGKKKCGLFVMKKGKIVESDGIQLPVGETITITEQDGYKYLGILELDKFMEAEMKKTFVKEYERRLRLVLK